MEAAVSRNRRFYRDRRIMLTGHTGFKGAWLSMMLHSLGARTSGYALPAEEGSLYEKIRGDELIESVYDNLSDADRLKEFVTAFQPEVVFHLAAFGFVKECHADPIRAYRDNVVGTGNLLEALRGCKSVKSVVLVSTDKVYENHGDGSLYMEEDALGGTGPYASSKVCMEFLVKDYRDTYFRREGNTGIAVVRASNVLGGGDHIKSRLIPSILRAVAEGTPVELRHPEQIRPWQSVQDALNGYLTIGRLLYEDPEAYSEAWNIGPVKDGIRSVGWVFEKIQEAFQGLETRESMSDDVPEDTTLGLDIGKVLKRTDWRPLMPIEQTIFQLVDFFRKQTQGIPERAICYDQIESFYGGRHGKTLEK